MEDQLTPATLAEIIKSQRLVLEKLEAFNDNASYNEKEGEDEVLVNVRSILDEPVEIVKKERRISTNLLRRMTKQPSLSRLSQAIAKQPMTRLSKARGTILGKVKPTSEEMPEVGSHDCFIGVGAGRISSNGNKLQRSQGVKNFQRLVKKSNMQNADGKVHFAEVAKAVAQPINEEQQQSEYARKVTCHVRAGNKDRNREKRLMYFEDEDDVWDNWILRPEGFFRRLWDAIIIFLVLFDVLYIPAIIGFHKFEELVDSWEKTDIILDLMFVIDIFIIFRTGYRGRNGKMVTNPKKIAVHYAHGLLVPDILASIPFGLISILGRSSKLQFGPVFGFLKLPRLLRLAKVAKYLERSQYATVWRIFRLCWMVYVIAHWLACGWFFILTAEDQLATDWTSDGAKELVDPESPGINYSYCLHTAMLLLLGDNVYPTTVLQRYYCTVALMIGACVVATVMGNVSLLIQNQHSLSAKFKTKMDCVNESMRALNFPAEMITRIRLYYDYLWQKNRTLGNNWISEDLSITLRTEVGVFLNRALLSKCTLFHRCSVNALLMIVDSLTTEVFLPGDNIIRDGDIGLEMYFLVKGRAFVVKFKKQIAELSPGQYFGERSLINQAERRTCDVQASTYCDLRVLSKTRFLQVASVYPELRRLILKDNPTTFARASVVASRRKSNFSITGVDSLLCETIVEEFTEKDSIADKCETRGANHVRFGAVNKVGL